MTMLIKGNKGWLTEERNSNCEAKEEELEIKPFSDEAGSSAGHRAKKEIQQAKILT